MEKVDPFSTSVLYLTFSVALADGVRVHAEEQAINKILKHENISESMAQNFLIDSKSLSVKEMRKIGVEALNKCPVNEQIRAYAWIYKIMEIDGRVDVKEAKFLLYALKDSNIELDEVLKTSLLLPQL